MKQIMEHYGAVILVAIAIIVLIALIYFFKDPLKGYFSDLFEKFFTKSTEGLDNIDTSTSFDTNNAQDAPAANP